MKYLSVCSGIEAASVAWHELGWNPVAFSEIEKFPCAVLAHRFPTVPNLGDMTKFNEWPNYSIDLLAGGTPCQAFSVAGLRQGLADPRGNLTLTFLAVAAKYRPRWIVWENVPGVLSDRTNAFGQFLAGLAELGYGWAYRMLDAQYFGLAQRRKRVFVVAYLGDWTRAAAVLFESESLRGDNPPSRETRKEITGTLSARTQGGGGLGTDFDLAGGIQASTGGADENDAKDGRLVASECIPIQEPGKRTGRSTSDRGCGVGIAAEGEPMYTLQAGAVHGVAHSTSGAGYWTEGVNALRAREQESHEHLISHTLKGVGFDASEDGTGRGTPLIPVDRWPASVAPTLNAHFGEKQGLEDQHALGGSGLFVPAIDFSCKDHAADAGEASPTLRSMGDTGSHPNAGGQVAVAFHPTQDPISSEEVTHGLGCGSSHGQASIAVAFQESQSGCREYDTAGCLRAAGPGHDPVGTRLRLEMSVRRLTPKECERLQGFPDDWTNIPWRSKPTSPDGPRYKAIGNSMAVPCMRWIGRRIHLFGQIPILEDDQ